jgi:geranylgeranyl transferase type-1 subunit beta
MSHVAYRCQTLSLASLVNAPPNTSFLLDAQSPIGGFGKAPEDFPDPFHSYLALAALALTPARDELGLKELDPVWNLPPVARDWLLSGGNESA